MAFKLEFDTDNAAFDDGNAEEEIARILRTAAEKASYGLVEGTIRDSNGNKIGKWERDAPCGCDAQHVCSAEHLNRGGAE